MIKTHKSAILWVLAALVCIVMLTVPAQAAEFHMGPGDHYDQSGNIVALDGTVLVKSDGTVVKNPFSDNANAAKETKADAGKSASDKKYTPNFTASDVSDGKVYSFEGKRYIKDSLYGTRKLTGYAEAEFGTAKTYSGKTAKSAHTVAAPSDLPIGTIIIVEAESGPYPSRYTGMYVVEDRGGEALESQGLIDIFVDSIEEAEAVTAAGWNYAKIWIAKPVG